MMINTIEYIDKVTDYMEYLMGGKEQCKILVAGWKKEAIAHHILNIAMSVYPRHRMAALGIIGAMLYATQKNRTIQ